VVFGSSELKDTVWFVVSISENANSVNEFGSAVLPYSTTAIVSFPVSHDTEVVFASTV